MFGFDSGYDPVRLIFELERTILLNTPVQSSNKKTSKIIKKKINKISKD